MIHLQHSGGLGDVIYGLPYIQSLYDRLHIKEIRLYVKVHNEFHYFWNNYDVLKRLLEAQPQITELMPASGDFRIGQKDPSIRVDVDLDLFRNAVNFQHHLIETYFVIRREPIPVNWNAPWLRLPEIEPELKDKIDKMGKYIIINRTERYHNEKVKWVDIINSLKDTHDNIIFIGAEKEYHLFEKDFKLNTRFELTKDLLEAAFWIKHAEDSYINQSVCLTLCQGIGVHYNLELWTEPTNTTKLVRTYLPNERIIPC